MRDTLRALASTDEPIVSRAGRGYRWIARAPAGASPQIAVLGKSREEAKAHYIERVAVWRAIPDRSATR